MTIPTPTPHQLGYRMPAEWEPQSATWMTWPARENTSFPGEGHHDAVLPTFLEMTRAILSCQELFLNVTNQEDRDYVLGGLTSDEQKRLKITDIPGVYPWCRDHGSIFILDDEGRQLAATNWEYNAWGGKYPEILHHDARINRRMSELLGVRAFEPGIVLEGGSIDVNGCGSVLTTESCLLNPNRNPHLTKLKIESYLQEFLGITNVLWLGEGIVGDDTDGHIDDITRFINPETVVTAIEKNASDVNHEPLEQNLQRLRRMKTEDGSLLNIVTLPMPAPVISDGERLPASYANFYIANDVVLLPVFEDPNDDLAMGILEDCFPGRRIVPINSRQLVWGLGSFHCLTQQVPAVRGMS